MISRKHLILWLVLGACAASASAGPIVYVITGSQQIGTMDLATGSFSPIGPIPPTIQYLVTSPNGSLLTMSFDGNLDSVNPNSGAISVIGPTGFADCSSPSSPTCGPNSQLSFGSAGGTLYAADFANNLYTVDPATGNATLVGATGIPGIPFIPVSTNPDGSFNFYDENLFDVGGSLYANFDAGSFNPNTFEFTTVISAALYGIDVNTGQATEIAPTDFGLVTVLNVNGTVYGFNGVTNQIVTLDVTNGITSAVSSIDPSAGLIGGAAPVPEPGSVALAVIGLMAVSIYWRRTRRPCGSLPSCFRGNCMHKV
jgi:PEP-CTERM motif